MNVLVIEASSLNIGYLPCYGCEWVATPNVDRLAALSVVFDRHIADCPGASVRTSWTGRYDFPMPEEETPRASASPTLEQMLAESGVYAAIVPAPSREDDADPVDQLVRSVQKTFKRLTKEKRWLTWITLPSLAPPWEAPEECLEPYFPPGPSQEDAELLTPWFDPPLGLLPDADDSTWERLQNTYAAAVTYFDFQLTVLLEEIEACELGDDFLLCVTADRGLPLLEHGAIGACRPWLHEEQVHLPLLMRFPGAVEAGRRIFALSQPVDLLPTVLSALEVPVPEGLHGHNLLPLARGQTAAVREYACSGLRIGERLEWALRTPDWAYLLPVRQAVDDPPRPSQLYVKPDDRWEVNNLVQQQLELVDSLDQTLRGFVTATRQPGALQPPTLSGAQ